MWLLLAGCQADGPGADTQDALKTPVGIIKTPFCVECHYVNESIDPRLINGSLAAGSHVAHLEAPGIFCETCHTGYYEQTTHFNGALDTKDADVLVVFFDSNNPDASWENDSGSQTGSCANTSCHTPNTPDWYNPVSN